MREKVVLVAGLMALSTGCASIVTGGKQPITVNSNVPGAVVAVNGQQIGTTPYVGEIKRDSATRVTVSKMGYYPQTIVLATTLEPWFWGNILLGGVFGSSTDAGTGAMNKYAPDSYVVALVPTVRPVRPVPPAPPAPPANPSEAAPGQAVAPPAEDAPIVMPDTIPAPAPVPAPAGK